MPNNTLKSVEIENFLGCSRARIQTTGLTLVAGPNASGKSSVENAVRFAIIGEIPRVALKKEYGQLVKSGAAFATTKIIFEDDVSFDLKLTKAGKIEGVRPMKATPIARVCLSPWLFASMPTDERKTMLLELLGVGIRGEEALGALVERGVDRDMVAETLAPALTDGFGAAEDAAKNMLTQLRADWKAITGTTYGKEIAETWAAELPEPIEGDITTLQKRVDKIGKEQAQLLSELAGEKLKLKVDEKRAEEWRTAAAKIGDLRTSLTVIADKLLEIEAKQISLRQFIASKHIDCPSCGASLQILADGTVEEIDELPDMNAAQAALATAVAEAKQLERDRAGARDNLEWALDAQNELARLEKIGLRDDAKIEAASKLFDELARDRTEALTAMKLIADYDQAVEAALSRTERAAEIHASIKAWAEVARLCSPEGIPGELLAKSLKKINDHAAKHGDALDLAPRITADAEITINSRLYGLCSESERWRADAILAVTIAQLSGFGIALIDRFDVLDVLGREVVVSWLKAIQDVRVLLFGVLKNPPMIDGIQCYWMESGRCVNTDELFQEEATA